MGIMKKFFKEHMEYLAKNDIEGMVKNTFTEDAVLCHNFRFFKGEPPYTARGAKDIIEMEKVIFDPKNQGIVTAGEPFNVIEEENFLGFQVIATSSNTGRWLMSDAWVLRGGKIAIYYCMGYSLEAKK